MFQLGLLQTSIHSSLCNMHCLLRLTLIVPCNFSRSIYIIQSKVRCLTEVLVTLATEIFLFSSALPSKTDSHLSHTETSYVSKNFLEPFLHMSLGVLFLFAGETWLCSEGVISEVAHHALCMRSLSQSENNPVKEEFLSAPLYRRFYSTSSLQ